MIVNYRESGWEIITQRAHGLLAAQLAYQWKEKYHPHRWVETLLAIAGHDDMEFEFTTHELLTPSGGPINYTMRPFEERHCQRQHRSCQARSQYITLLSSMHQVFLYRNDPKAEAFVQVQRRLQAALRKKLGLPKAEADRIYSLMQWCDALSLMICQHTIQPEHRMSEISKGPDGRTYQILQVKKNVFSVQPWPFTLSRFEVTVESRGIRQLSFENGEQFRQALLDARVTSNRYTFVRG
jgi:hypothetical protein